jgi:hypothetical protein
MNLWGRNLNIPYDEYSVMPIGEFSDLIDAYLIMNGKAEEKIEDSYIPNLR